MLCNSKTYMWQKKCMSLYTKKYIYTQKMIEMIFSLYEIYNIYQTL
jgi:hypothetical protein